jgi:LysM repeat protein
MKRILLGVVLCTLLVTLGTSAVWAAPSGTGHIVHVVRWGENLTSIAAQYGTTIHAIVHANGLASQNRIYAGQRLIIPGSTPSPSAPATCGQTYTIRYGDTLSGIAYRFGVSQNALMRANGIVNPNRIYRGQRLVIPCGSQPGPPYHPSQPKPAPYYPPHPKPDPYAGCSTWYIVHRGDTLAKIAWRYKTSVWAIVRANNIANPNVIHVGQRLCIPQAGPWPTPKPKPYPSKPGCEHLISPRPGARLSGVVHFKGTAVIEDFWYYKLEYRADGLDNWHYITGEHDEAVDDYLGSFDTRGLPDGTYFVRLVIVDRTGNYPPPCEFVVYIDNHW